MPNRPAIPMELQRRVKVEAGHKCAIPACGNTTIELAHIEPWSKARTHEFHNLIALCPTCHTRYDKGEIDRKSMEMYKAALDRKPSLAINGSDDSGNTPTSSKTDIELDIPDRIELYGFSPRKTISGLPELIEVAGAPKNIHSISLSLQYRYSPPPSPGSKSIRAFAALNLHGGSSLGSTYSLIEDFAEDLVWCDATFNHSGRYEGYSLDVAIEEAALVYLRNAKATIWHAL